MEAKPISEELSNAVKNTPSQEQLSRSLRQIDEAEEMFHRQARWAWASSGLSQRHIDKKVNFASSEQWTAAYKTLKAKIGTGFLAALTGIRGTGKTQMAAMLMYDSMIPTFTDRTRWIDADFNNQVVKYVTAMDFFLSLRSTFRPKASKSELDVLRDLSFFPTMLVIDEVQERGNTEFEDRMLTHLIDKRYGAKKDTILISNLSPTEFAKSVGPSVVSRANETGGIIECTWESFRK